jgi:UTP--glucose-1-phosphate uridylyltransferase
MYGVVGVGKPHGKAFSITKMVEKPKREEAPSNLSITGRYILQPEIFDQLATQDPGAGGEIQLTDAMRLLAKEQGLWAYIYEGISYDAGDKLGFLRATVELALQNTELGSDFRAYLKSLKL